jgi:hypothetical protein
MADGYCGGSSGYCVLTPSPPGILYGPNMTEEQNEQHKSLPKRIPEVADGMQNEGTVRK